MIEFGDPWESKSLKKPHLNRALISVQSVYYHVHLYCIVHCCGARECYLSWHYQLIRPSSRWPFILCYLDSNDLIIGASLFLFVRFLNSADCDCCSVLFCCLFHLVMANSWLIKHINNINTLTYIHNSYIFQFYMFHIYN